MNALHQNLYGNYRNRKFSDIWSEKQYTKEEKEDYFGNGDIDDVGIFLQDYHDNGIPVSISDATATTLFYLLYARYGNSTVASSDENQFKYKIFSTIFQYGPTWEKRLEIQKNVRELSLDELMDGGKAVYNQALNPGQQVSASGTGGPSTNTLDELTYINQQNTTKYKKSKVDAYGIILDLLKTDVTEEFIGKFKKLFLAVVSPELPLWYVTNLNGDDENDD